MLFGILVVLALAIVVVSVAFLTPIRRSVYGVIGIFGSYVIFAGFAMTVAMVGAFIKSGGIEITGTTIFYFIFTFLCIAYLVYLMIAECESVGQRIWLPFAAILIAFGAFYRFIFALIGNVPMGDPTPASSDESEDGSSSGEFQFPSTMYSKDARETYRHEGHGSYICDKTGHRVQFRDSDFVSGTPSGWDVY